MKIVDGENNKRKIIVISSSIVSGLIIIIGSIFLFFDFNSSDEDKVSANEEENEETEENETKISKNKEISKDIEEDIDSDNLGDIPEDSTRVEKFDKDEIEQKINEINKQRRKDEGRELNPSSNSKPSSNGGNSNSSSTSSGSNSSSNSEDSSEVSTEGNGSNDSGSSNNSNNSSNYNKNEENKDSNNNDNKSDEDEKEKPETPEDNDILPIDKLIATATIETENVIKHSSAIMDKSLSEESNDPYNVSLLKETLDNPNSDKRVGIDNHTYKQTRMVVQNWLFNYDEVFSWDMIKLDQYDSIFKNIVINKLYNENFSSMNSQSIDMLENGSDMDNHKAIFTMNFNTSSGSYKGVYSVEDNMPRLLDITIR